MLTDPNALAAKAWEAIHRFDADAIPPGIRADEIAANAHLIAAAPTLADHHERILDMVDRFRFESDADVFRLLDEIADQARAALAQARGGV